MVTLPRGKTHSFAVELYQGTAVEPLSFGKQVRIHTNAIVRVHPEQAGVKEAMVPRGEQQPVANIEALRRARISPRDNVGGFESGGDG